jgi:protein TonB
VWLLILLVHVAAVWALLQVEAVRQTVKQVAPLFVSLVVPAAPQAVPQPAQPPREAARPLPKRQPQPAPLIAAAPEAAPSSETFVAPAAPAPVTPPAVAAPAAAPAQALPAEATPPVAAARELPDSAVQFLRLPEVVYPRLSQRHGETGLVVVRAYVGAGGGAPYSVHIEKSSGHPRLDQAALAAVQKSRFKPYAEKGQPVEGWALVPIRFELENWREP